MEKVKSIFGFISGSSSKKREASAKKESAKKASGIDDEEREEEMICINEIQHLVGHTDLVRNLVCVNIDGERLQYLISSSDDATIRIWNPRSGELIHTLTGHTMPIKSILVIDNRSPTSAQGCTEAGSAETKSFAHSLILVSSSSDRTIRIWDILTGESLQTLDKQKGSVLSLAAIPTQNEPQETGGTPPLSSGACGAQTVQLAPRVFKNVWRFCSGATDNDIQIWDITSDKGVVHSGTIKSYDSEKENLSWVLAINSMYVAVGSSSNCGIVVYSLKDFSFFKFLTYHKELPQSIACLSSRQFVSGSLDGIIIVWNSENFLAEYTLHSPAEYLKDEKKYLYNVSFLLPINERYVVAAIGKGFTVFELHPETGSFSVVLRCLNAHGAALTCALTLCNGAYLLTSSEDSVIKMWKVPPHINFGGKTAEKENKGGPLSRSDDVPRPELVAELFGHTATVTDIVKIDEYSFASSSLDAEVIVWKDGYRQSELRNEYAVFSLMHNN